MKYLLKLFVRSLLSPTISLFYFGAAALAFVYLNKAGHFFAAWIPLITTFAILGFIHAGRRATEKEESEALIKNN